MWLNIRLTFNDGRDKFVENERRFVSDKMRARKFIGYGWAEDASKPGGVGFVPEAAASVDLDIKSGTLGMRDTNNG